jgi:integrase
VDKGEWTDPSKQPLGAYLDEWLAGLRLAPSTVASYRKNVRLHVKPYIGTVPLATMAAAGTALINAIYRELERGGRRDHKGERTGQPLAARTVRYIHTILSAALAEAVAEHRLAVNPAARGQAADRVAGEGAGDAGLVAGAAGRVPGLGRARRPRAPPAWYLLAHTGMRRGEAFALRWRDVDLDAGTVSVCRSASMIRVAGESAEVTEGDTKSGKPRMVDIDPATVAVLRAPEGPRRAGAAAGPR